MPTVYNPVTNLYEEVSEEVDTDFSTTTAALAETYSDAAVQNRAVSLETAYSGRRFITSEEISRFVLPTREDSFTFTDGREDWEFTETTSNNFDIHIQVQGRDLPDELLEILGNYFKTQLEKHNEDPNSS